MDILVLLKAVPLVGEERLDDRHQSDRANLEANGADEYCLERALQLVESDGGAVSVLTMGPTSASEALRKALAMGAERAYHVLDDRLEGSDIGATVRVLEAAVRRVAPDLLFAGVDSSDGRGGVVGAALAARLGLPYLSHAADVRLVDGPAVRVRRLAAGGHDVLESPLPALVMGTQLLGEPRYPSLRGIMAARSKETLTWSLEDLGIDAASVGWAASGTLVRAARAPEARAAASVVQAPPEEAVERIVEFLAQRGFA